MIGLSRVVSTLAVVVSACAATSAVAQANPPRHLLDQNNIDLASGTFNFSMTDVAIGPQGDGGLSFSRTWSIGNRWRTVADDEVTFTSTKAWVTLNGVSVEFNRSGSAYAPVEQHGQTLALNAPYFHYTSSDGSQYRFMGIPGGRQVLRKIIRSNGEMIDINYVTATTQEAVTTYPPCEPDLSPFPEECVPGEPTTEYQDQFHARLQSISNNRGYQIRMNYAGNDVANDANAWMQLTGAVGFNMAIEACDPLALFCTLAPNWPTIQYSVVQQGADVLQQFTDGLSRTTTLRTYAGQLAGIRSPGSPTEDVGLTYVPGGRVASIRVGSNTWTYAYSTAGANLTATLTDPLSNQSVAHIDLAKTLVLSSTDPLGRTTSYLYDTDNRLTRTTRPEGDYAAITYDTRGNVTQVRAVAKPGSGLADIVTSATYDAVCSNPRTCNQPLTTTDPRGGVTDYAYDAGHGGVTAVTSPAPAGGAVRPQVRMEYSSLHAWYKDGSGALIQAPSAVVLPTASSTCATAASCTGGADEVRTVITRGTPGSPNNLLPTVVASGSGDGSLTATTTLTHTGAGDVATVDGPLPGPGDTSRMRYDSERQLVGMVGPDPDGGSPLKPRAVRYSHAPDGLPVLVEQGTVNGQGDGDWAGFVSLQQVATAYDDVRRPIRSTQMSGGVTHAVQQVSYDAAGRTDCVATRMNPEAFGALPGSACDMGAPGAFGPDRITRMSYNPAGDTTAVTSGHGTPTPITEAATYTPNGLPQTLTDGNGNVSTVVYDGFDRAERMHYPNAAGGGTSSTDYEQWVYDAGSNVTGYRNRAGETETTSFDALGRPTLTVRSAAPSTAVTYDNLGRALTVSGNGQVLGLGWDALGRQTHETSPLGTVSYGHDVAGRRVWMGWPDGFWVAYDHNWAGDLTAIRENGATDWALASHVYDDLGRRAIIYRGNGAHSVIGYDNAGRLSSLTHDAAGTAQDVVHGYTYNPAGQIVGKTTSNPAYVHTAGAGVISYQNNGRNQVTSVNGIGIGYDNRGNITASPTGTFGYDGLNRLTTAGVYGLTYDPLGRLNSTSTGSVATRFLYDGLQAIAEYDAAGALTRRHVPGLAMDETLVSYTGSGYDRRWLLADERGSIVALADTAGSVTGINTYDDYGVPGEGNAGLFQYTGQVWLGQVGLYHYKARAYDPSLGRFLQTDPIGYAAGMNLYGYVGGDPVNFIDPLGLQEDRVDDVIVWGTPNARGSSGGGFGATGACTRFGGPELTSYDTGMQGPLCFGGGGQVQSPNQCAANIATGAAWGAAAGAATGALVGCASGTLVTAVVGAPVACPAGGAAAVPSGTALGAAVGGSVGAATAACHGNDLRSTRRNTVYRLVDSDGNTLKFGVTCQRPSPCRYSTAYLQSINADFVEIQTHDNRLSARIHELGLCTSYVLSNHSRPPLSRRC